MPLDIPISIDEIDDSATAIPSKTAKIDFDKGRITGYIDGLDAMEQFVMKALMTERFSYLVYSNQYGAELAALVGRSEDDIFEFEAKRMIRDALLCDARITGVRDFEFKKDGDAHYVKFSVDTVYGPLNGQEVTVSV